MAAAPFRGRPIFENEKQAIDRLKLFTGQDFGNDAARWGEWLRKNRRVYHSVPGQVSRTREMDMTDEQAIRNLVSTWMSATKAGDTATVLSLMADDVVFMVPGGEPFGKEAFAAASNLMKGATFDGISEIIELQVLGDWAWLRNHIRITITPPGGKPMIRKGYTLTILRKQANGKWVLSRDANLVM